MTIRRSILDEVGNVWAIWQSATPRAVAAYSWEAGVPLLRTMS